LEFDSDVAHAFGGIFTRHFDHQIIAVFDRVRHRVVGTDVFDIVRIMVAGVRGVVVVMILFSGYLGIGGAAPLG
jgi:hypothetical protein